MRNRYKELILSGYLFAIIFVSCSQAIAVQFGNTHSTPLPKHLHHRMNLASPDKILKSANSLTKPQRQDQPENSINTVEQLDSTYFWSWNIFTLGWDFWMKKLYTYDSNGDNIEEMNYIWNTTTWDPSDKTTRSFNANHQMINEVSETWNGGVWINQGQTKSLFDVTGNLQTQWWMSWNAGISTWDTITRFTYGYDVNNNQVSSLTETFDAFSMSWQNYQQSQTTFDVNNYAIGFVVQDWIMGAWENNFYDSITWDMNYNLIAYTSLFWVSNAWMPGLETSYSYDVNNNLIWEIRKSWNNGWENNTGYFYAYDSNDFLVEWLYKNWNGTGWDEFIRYAYTNNSYGDRLSQLSEQWNGSGYDSYDSTYYYYSMPTNVWNPFGDQPFFNAFPNPSEGIFTLEWKPTEAFEISETIFVLDQGGRKVLERPFGRTVDLRELVAGVYYLQLKETGVFKKVIKR